MPILPYPTDWRDAADALITEIPKLVTGEVDLPKLVHCGWVVQGYLLGRFYPDGGLVFTRSTQKLTDTELVEQLKALKNAPEEGVGVIEWLPLLKTLALLLLRLLADNTLGGMIGALMEPQVLKHDHDEDCLETSICQAKCACLDTLAAIVHVEHHANCK